MRNGKHKKRREEKSNKLFFFFFKVSGGVLSGSCSYSVTHENKEELRGEKSTRGIITNFEKFN